jgi:hypothetical protein
LSVIHHISAWMIKVREMFGTVSTVAPDAVVGQTTVVGDQPLVESAQPRRGLRASVKLAGPEWA